MSNKFVNFKNISNNSKIRYIIMLLRHLVEQMTLLKIGQIISVDVFFFF